MKFGYIVCSYFPDARKKYCHPIAILEFHLEAKKMMLWWNEPDVQKLIPKASPLMQRLLIELPIKLPEVVLAGKPLKLPELPQAFAEHISMPNIAFSDYITVEKPLTAEDKLKIHADYTVPEEFTMEKEAELVCIG